jgi:hypothetical protein
MGIEEDVQLMPINIASDILALHPLSGESPLLPSFTSRDLTSLCDSATNVWSQHNYTHSTKRSVSGVGRSVEVNPWGYV